MAKLTHDEAEHALGTYFAPKGQAGLHAVPSSNNLRDFQVLEIQGAKNKGNTLIMHVAGQLYPLSGNPIPWPRQPVSGGGGGISIPSIANTPKTYALTGTMNGVNTAFVIPIPFVEGTEQIFFNGVKMVLATWYTIVGSNVTVIGSQIPNTGDTLEATVIPS